MTHGLLDSFSLDTTLLDHFTLDGVVGGRGSDYFFGDGSDGNFDSRNLLQPPTVPTVSAPSGGIAGNLIDGNNATYLITGAGGARVLAEFDFGKAVAIKTFTLINAFASASTTVQIEFSPDNINWSPFTTTFSISTTNQTIARSDTSTGIGRYWRIRQTTTTTNRVVNIGETTFSSVGADLILPATDYLTIQCKSFYLDKDHTLTTNIPCKGLIIYCDGHAEINGMISMDSKAATESEAPLPALLPLFEEFNRYHPHQLNPILSGGGGGSGGRGGTAGNNGGSGYAGGTIGSGYGRLLAGGFGAGGGGGGAPGSNQYAGSSGGSIIVDNPTVAGNGGTGGIAIRMSGATIGTGSSPALPGGGGGGGTMNSDSMDSQVWAGPGGRCNGAGGGGGSGGGGSNGSSAAVGNGGSSGEYAGGFICIVAKSITIASTGRIYASGGNGGRGGNGVSAQFHHGSGGGGGGGGSGGGVVIIAYSNGYTNAGSIVVSGGSGGAGGAGGSGGPPSGYQPGETGVSGSSGRVGRIHILEM